jgi:selenide,water dikinase
VLRQLPTVNHPDLLVGVSTADDAAVYRLSDDLAVIQTVDFFPPIVDDPRSFGEIAVANALSDVYAMGGRPLLGLNIVGFPRLLSKDILVSILQGGASKAAEAGVLVAGGHTVDDAEPKYGMAVTGVVKPGMQVMNSTLRPGDVLVLTKPIGTGIITTAGKDGVAEIGVLEGAIRTMAQLNHAASDVMVEVGVSACTDITGFGLVGHLLGMLEASDAHATLRFEKVPLLDGARDLVDQGVAPGGTRRNLEHANRGVTWDRAVDEQSKLLLCDAQTSGGLLISVPEQRLDRLLYGLKSRGVETADVVAEVHPEGAPGDRRLNVVA